MFKLYGDLNSGNCYKVKLLLHLLDIEHEWVDVDILKNETHTEEFLAINPNGKIPALVMPRGDVLWESNAILNYLADGTRLLPSKKFIRSKVLQWQFFEQYSHEPYIAVARYIKVYLGMPDSEKARYDSVMPKGYKALDVMEEHLAKHTYFVGDFYSIADISLYAYTHVAEQGGFNLKKYPSIINWMSRIESQLKHQTMQDFIGTSTRKKRAEKRLRESISEMSGSYEALNTAAKQVRARIAAEDAGAVSASVADIKEDEVDAFEDAEEVPKRRGFVRDILGMLGRRKEKSRADQELFMSATMDELNAYKAGLGVAPDSDKSPDNVTTPEQDAQTSFSNSSENIATQTDSNTPGPDNKTDAKEQSKHSSEDASKADISNAEAEQNANAETSSENETDKDFEKAPAEVKLDNSRSIHELMISDIDGKEIAFKEYKNRVVMLVNVASECGYTPQYRGLHVLHEKYRNRGFTVIGVPCNQFGGQEPGREAEIKAFCLVNYNVMFPLTSKIEVNGPRQHPLYDVLTGADAEYPGDISWNFEKFLIGKDGKVIKRYAPAVEPTSSEVIRDVEKALGQ